MFTEAPSYLIFWAGWTVWGSDSSGGGGFLLPSGAAFWGPPSPLYGGYQVSFLGVKLPGHGVDHPSSSS